jgi:hypothetical protein
MFSGVFDLVEVMADNLAYETMMLTIRTSDFKLVEQRLHKLMTRMP